MQRYSQRIFVKIVFSLIKAFLTRLLASCLLLPAYFKQLQAFLLLLASCFLLLNSCTFNPNYQGKGSDFLQGEWRQDSVEREKMLVSYSRYNFKFSCDSFYVGIKSVSKVNYGSDTCMKAGHWMEYAKGTYTQQGDTLRLTGFFCNADYSLKKEGGCFRFGAYEDNMKIGTKTDSSLTLLSSITTIPINLKLVKRVQCVAKPL